MRYIGIQDANQHLKNVGMRVGKWNKVFVDPDLDGHEADWIRWRAPSNAKELYVFSLHVTGWLLPAKWALLCIDDSTVASIDEAYFLGGVFDSSFLINFGRQSECRSVMFDGLSEDIKLEDCFKIAHAIYLFLLFEYHGYLVSSASAVSPRCLGIQDGFIYFIAQESGLLAADELLKQFESSPSILPNWAIDISP